MGGHRDATCETGGKMGRFPTRRSRFIQSPTGCKSGFDCTGLDWCFMGDFQYPGHLLETYGYAAWYR